MDEVVAADGRAVAVTHGDKDIEVRIAKGNPGCGRKGTAVRHVHAVDVQVVINTAKAANPADKGHVVLIHFQFSHDSGNGLEHNAVAAAGAPGLRQFIKEHIILVGLHYSRPPLTALTTSSGVMRTPSVRFA